MRPALMAAAAERLSPEAEVAIRARRVGKTFGAGMRALDQVDFDVRRGEFVSILGPSGCGKSTLLRVVAGLFEPDGGGELQVLGKPQAGVSADVGVVFQTHNMLPWATVESNMRLAAEVRGLARAEIDERINTLLPILKLEKFRRSYPHELSGGMRQRAAIGQILITRPRILLLDEPFGALDALTRDQLNVELLRLWQEMRQTVILITHSIPEAVFLSDRVLVMSERPGRVIKEFQIDLPRPREPKATKELPQFARHVVELGQIMGVE